MAPPTQPSESAQGVKADLQTEDPDSSIDAPWDEERLEKAMDTLHELYIQCRNLRTTIPRLVAPITVKHPSPQQMFRSFDSSSKTANREVQQFRTSMNDKVTKDVLDYTVKSRAEKPEGIRPWMIAEHPDWHERKT